MPNGNLDSSSARARGAKAPFTATDSTERAKKVKKNRGTRSVPRLRVAGRGRAQLIRAPTASSTPNAGHIGTTVQVETGPLVLSATCARIRTLLAAGIVLLQHEARIVKARPTRQCSASGTHTGTFNGKRVTTRFGIPAAALRSALALRALGSVRRPRARRYDSHSTVWPMKRDRCSRASDRRDPRARALERS